MLPNPYYMVITTILLTRTTVIYGKLELSYDITKDIKVIGRFGGDYTNYKTEAHRTTYSLYRGFLSGKW